MNKTTNNSSKSNGQHFSSKASMEKALNTFADLMIERIESITQDWRKPWFTEGAVSWPRNLNGREYNGMNALMLTMHCEKEGYKYPVFCTFDRVMNYNFYTKKDGTKCRVHDEKGAEMPTVCVRKGEKGFPVFITTFTVVSKTTGDKIKYEDYRVLGENERAAYSVFPKLITYTVFNIDQTNMKELRPELYDSIIAKNTAEVPVLNPDSCVFEPIDRMIAEDKWICPIEPTRGDEAYYSISKKKIVFPLKEQFVSGEAYYSNLLHEMTHSTGDDQYLGRFKEPSHFGDAKYATEELVAELTAALVANRYGMSKHIKEDSAAYLKNWLGSLRKSPDFIKTVLLDVKKASYIITNKIEAVASYIKTEVA